MEGDVVMDNEKLSRIVGLRLLAIKEGVECGAIREVVMDVDKKFKGERPAAGLI